MNKDDLQVLALKKIIKNQKNQISNSEMSKKITFILCSKKADYYHEKFSEIAILFNIIEGLIMEKKLHRAVNYICIVNYTIKRLTKQIEKDFKEVVKEMT